MTIEIGLIMSILSLIIAFQGYALNKQKQVQDKSKSETNEAKNDAKESAEIKAQLGYISKGVDDIRIDLKANEKQIGALSEKVARIDESAKQAHKRLDKIVKGEI
jgi:septal ring factor EnvC (AmiA/AmiB activator)